MKYYYFSLFLNIKAAIALCKSNIQLGILCKKSTSGKKAFLKAFLEGKELIEDSESECCDEDVKKVTLKNVSKKQKVAKKIEKVEKKINASPKKERLCKKKEIIEETYSDFENFEDELEEEDKRLTNQQVLLFENAKKDALKKQIHNSKHKENHFEKNRRIIDAYQILLTLKNKCSLQIKMDKNFSKQIPQIYPGNNEDSLHKRILESHDFQSNIIDKDTHPSKEDKEYHTNLVIYIPDVNDDVWNLEEGPEIHDSSPKHKALTHLSYEEKCHKSNNEEAYQIHSCQKQNEKFNDITLKRREDRELQIFAKELSMNPGKNLTTLSTRLELYTSEESWKTSSPHTKNLLYTFITYATEALQTNFREWTLLRNCIAQKKNFDFLFENNDHIILFECDPKYEEQSLKSIISDERNLNWKFDPLIKAIPPSYFSKKKENLKCLKSITPVSLAELQGIVEQKDKECSSFALPLYQISTRDSFAYDLVKKVTFLTLKGRKVKKTEYFFESSSYPSNFSSFIDKFPDCRVGVVTYTDFFTHDELCEIESKCYETERKFFSNHFLPMTGQMTSTNEKVKRTKFFFGARYMWTKQQLSEAHSVVGAGIRVDVSEPPKWMKDLVENPLVEASIIEKDFVNSIAMNVYHDGKEGIAQHFDDAVRFKQVKSKPIYSLRIFSDSRLSFGSQLYGFCNGAFCIPMPRGCITVMEESSYAANGIKHCVRPCDMTGKSAALILRQMHHRVFNEAKLYDEFVDFPTWFSTLSISEDAVSYSDQKRIEADEALKTLNKN